MPFRFDMLLVAEKKMRILPAAKVGTLEASNPYCDLSAIAQPIAVAVE